MRSWTDFCDNAKDVRQVINSEISGVKKYKIVGLGTSRRCH